MVCFAMRELLLLWLAGSQPTFFVSGMRELSTTVSLFGIPFFVLAGGEWKETLDPWWAVVAMQGGDTRGPKISHCRRPANHCWDEYWFACCSEDELFTKALSHHSTGISISNDRRSFR